MNRRLLFVSLFSLLTGMALADTPPSAATTPGTLPPDVHISPAGKKRVLENLGVVVKNIENVKTNLAATSQNKKTVEAELADLESLEKDHIELKKKYTDYLSEAEEELKKNEKSLRELTAWQNAVKAAGQKLNSTYQSKWDTVEQEKTEREKWKADAEIKISRVGKLMANLIGDMRDIQSRKGPLKNEIAEWDNRTKGYQKLLDELNAKKTSLEKLAKD